MSRIADILVRCVVVLAGYIAAALAASATLHLLFLGGFDWTPEEAAALAAGSMMFSIPLVALVISYFAFMPAMAVILIGEVLGLRNWLYYALGGGGVGAATALFIDGSVRSEMTVVAEALAATPMNRGETFADPGLAALMAACGIVGGLAYWLVAGRTAGLDRDRPSGPAPTGS